MHEKLLDIMEEVCDDKIVREDPDLNLFEEGLLDSLAIVEVLVAIEDEFGIRLSPTEYENDDLSTVRKIEQILEDKGVK